jgi:hypothetical protein
MHCPWRQHDRQLLIPAAEMGRMASTAC